MARNNTEIVYKIEEMIKKYNKKPEKKVKKKDIVDLLQKADIIMAMKSDFEDASLSYETIEGVSMKPEMVEEADCFRYSHLIHRYLRIIWKIFHL